MIFPLVAICGLLVWAVAFRPSGTPVQTLTSGVVFQTQAPLPPRLNRLLRTIQSGVSPSRWTIDEAIREAYENGNWDLVSKLARKFPRDEDGPSSDDGKQTVVIGRVSPFEGVPNDEWDRFVHKLETQKTDFKTDRHIGRYYHSLARLNQLGISLDDLTDPDKQYDALVADLSDSREKAKDLIRDFVCSPITIAGTDHVMTLSGILGLLKSAGPQKARSWIECDADREKFPRTTEMFLSTNGVF